MAGLRRRKGVVVFSDRMIAYHAQMERLLQQRPKLVTDSQGLMTLSGDAGALSNLMQRLSSEAPASLRARAEFGPLPQGVLDAEGHLRSMPSRAGRRGGQGGTRRSEAALQPLLPEVRLRRAGMP